MILQFGSVRVSTGELEALQASAATQAELDYIHGVTAGTVSASQALVVDSSKNLSGLANLNFADGATIGNVSGATTGLTLFAATGKGGFFGKTPATQPAAYTQTYNTASKTCADPTAPAITDSTGGTAATTFAAITAGASYAQADMQAVQNALAQVAESLNALNTDVASVKQNVNSMINDAGTLGLHA